MDQYTKAPPPELRTDRLLLRPISRQDTAAFFEIHSDADAMRYWTHAPITESSQAESLVQKELEWTASGVCINWGIALPDSNLLIGKCTLFQFSAQNRRAELGYILNRSYWRRGYMSETLRCVLDFAFGPLGLHRLEADTDPGNAASLTLLEKFGFRREGLFRERWNVSGRWLDSLMLGLLKSDYRRSSQDQADR